MGGCFCCEICIENCCDKDIEEGIDGRNKPVYNTFGTWRYDRAKESYVKTTTSNPLGR